MQGEASCQVIVPIPPRQVYNSLVDLGSYPRWMRDVRRVGRIEGDRSRWALHGPYGTVRWEVETTVDRPPHTFAWCARGPGMVGYNKTRLERLSRGRTRILTTRFLGTGRDEQVRSWWGDPEIRLRSDMGHFVEELRRRAGTPRASKRPHANAVSTAALRFG